MAYKNLTQLDIAVSIFNRASQFAKDSSFVQIKAKSISGLAEIYRAKQDFSTSVSLHLQAVMILDEIHAVPDLAETYYQLGITYQVMGEVEKSHVKFQEAIRLFTEMEAPKQVERVRQSIQSRK